jgi:hypothetical protein
MTKKVKWTVLCALLVHSARPEASLLKCVLVVLIMTLLALRVQLTATCVQLACLALKVLNNLKFALLALSNQFKVSPHVMYVQVDSIVILREQLLQLCALLTHIVSKELLSQLSVLKILTIKVDLGMRVSAWLLKSPQLKSLL